MKIKLVVKPIPKLARYLYLVGFVVLGSTLLIYFHLPNWLDSVSLLQLFIVGAIVVAVGSVINLLTQLKIPTTGQLQPRRKRRQSPFNHQGD